MQADLILKNANLPDGRTGVDIACKNGKIIEIGPQLPILAAEEIDCDGMLVSPPFVDSHFHMDATLSLGLPRMNESGTLLEGIALWGELKPILTIEAVIERALRYCDLAVSKGLLAIRTHVDVCDDRLLAVDALLEVKKQIAPYIDLQLVAFPQDGYLRSPTAKQNVIRALDKGVDVVGGIPHFERTMADGAQSITELCEMAAKRGLRVDMHCDETDDPLSRHIEMLAYETQRLDLQGQVAGSHLTSMHSMDNYYVSKLIALMTEAEVSVIANPLINITLQGRHDTYPKRRGMTRVPELRKAGLTVAFGHDCVMDPWYSMGSGDMLEVASMGLHVAQMTSRDDIRACFDAVTTEPAKIMGLEGYGIAVGNNADFVVLQARDTIEAIRLRANRLYVIRRGNIIAETPLQQTRLHLSERPETVRGDDYAPGK
ncbi:MULTISPECIES: amidohydrolase family protein [Thalassospira]|jgi:cytosine deaminase|uniref:Cytosine deaminase n=1 Tax=Thalassospira xiamenensis TaxID=220697 RepID=A0ABR5Y2X3_9PROT|nr:MULTISPECIES: amidohydrolase family protein [Thalassospira]MAL29501.1 cytosine deaminase [Thalassospira sp.]MBR9780257.1 amidohydrolase family protein [Rhodospirillales bacterium]KZD04817.1 cytosine deaminase [Thalassospira xiamenensis]KZD05595.1 cytosine deaminase [Thalassospira xiamenensis]MBL4839751.1 amidohydrolase family protein [Thalassospira sp.]|tara:strand:+ start:2530 stop:3819 length:1290 start_codon:yes stop_codon:yes gene_type:complete